MVQYGGQILEDDAREFYAVLNIPPDASDEDVRRAYRTLAQVYHPDKHTHPEQKERAQEAFGRLQEAYEVLSDPQKRQIYDVYGKEGLDAGFQLGDVLDSVDELKKKWEEFKKKQEDERSALLANHRGFYQCRIDATDLWQSLPGLKPRRSKKAADLRVGLAGQDLRPLFRSVVVQNSVDMPVGEADVSYIQGNATMRTNAGAGNLVCGYRRVLSPHDTLEASSVLGFRSILNLTSTRQVTPYTSASVTTTYTAGMGFGMQVSSTRHLPYNMQATLGWVVGPAPASGMTFNISKKGPKYVVAGKLELGAVTSISGRVVYQATSDTNVRAALRLGTTGVDLEVGAGRKWSSTLSGYMGAVVGLQGVTLKGRLIRGGQTFEVPVLLSHRYTDVRALATATLLPPLAYVTISRCVVRPLVRWQRRVRGERDRREHAEAVRASLQKAASERALIEPVARRKARSETAKCVNTALPVGLVILDAVYGNVESYLEAGGPQQQTLALTALSRPDQAPSGTVSDISARGMHTAVAAATATTGAGAAGVSVSVSGADNADWKPDAAGASTSSSAASADGAATASPGGTGGTSADTNLPPPPPWLSVTSALQYQVSDSKLTLHPGAAKKNQLGFADPTPGATAVRHLYVAYLYGSRAYEVTVDDTDGLRLPGAGEVVSDAARWLGLLRMGAAAHGVPELLQLQ